ncbi:MAG: sensor histidine kinase [Bacteroidales bacterium]|nr:sensor histidine kinase [Bacteroidales bacterium]
MSEQIKTLKFKFDVSAYRLLGRELITDRITALFELVKNCYDANAENVLVKFEDINPRSDRSKILIIDDGIGMSFEDVRDKWMVIGTSSKRKAKQSPPPYNRKVVGKKGVGRFAVDKLGAKLLLKTTKKGSDELLCLETDWSYYADEENKQLTLDFSGENKFFTDIENKYWTESIEKDSSGTMLEISMVSDVWTKNDIIRSIKELSKLISPSNKLKYPFNIVVDAAEYPDFKEQKVKTAAIELATLKVELGFDTEKNSQEILIVQNGELKKINVPERKCGYVGMTLYYFDQQAKNKFKKSFVGAEIDGVKVYRDGIIATPFAEYAASQNEQKDLLGIDKRRYSGFFDKLSTRDLLGWIEISEEHNPNIIDATNRQSFVENDAWKELKDFTIEQLSKIESYLKKKKNTEKEKTKSEFKVAKDEIGNIRKQLNLVKDKAESPEVQQTIIRVEKELAKTQATVQRSLADYQKLEKEKHQQENLFFSLVSLQTYAGMLSHITRTSIGKIKRDAEFIHKWIPDPRFNDSYKKMGLNVFTEMNHLGDAVDFLLKYAKDDQKFEEINVKETLERIFNKIYIDEFEKRGIKASLEINRDLLINYNLKSFEDIFDNLISNSFKAVGNNSGEKLIRCSAIVENDKFVILFSDNGYGIPEDNKYRIFDVFVTTTSEQGGAGLGLFIIKSRLEALKGTIQVVENEFKPTGATFKIELPFKQ